ncbi:hypothetical protein [Tateyamaria sp. SN3-11]|uniref:hypothetical protein n=1 Tax=Tateyamaria sp. SN3-11 TaxID=3092147 RepID=UPI0039E774CC
MWNSQMGGRSTPWTKIHRPHRRKAAWSPKVLNAAACIYVGYSPVKGVEGNVKKVIVLPECADNRMAGIAIELRSIRSKVTSALYLNTERRALNDDERTKLSETASWNVDWKELVGFAALGGGSFGALVLLAVGGLLRLMGIDTNGFVGLTGV